MRRLLRLAPVPVVLAVVMLLRVNAAFADNEGTAFVCPVFNSDAVGEHNPNAIQIGGGDYSIIPVGGDQGLSVPDTATNGDGDGSPGGAHSSPGDSDYTALWHG